jgi:hypothetical protein
MAFEFTNPTDHTLAKLHALCQIIHDGILRLEKNARLGSISNLQNKPLSRVVDH